MSGPALLLRSRLVFSSFLLLSLISLTIGDKPDSKFSLSGNAELSRISPRKLSLLGKALLRVVQSRKCPKVDDLELDTFQAYLNRQILGGDVQTLRHPVHFNSLYGNLSGCANFFSRNHSQTDRYLDERGYYVDDDGKSNEGGGGGSLPATTGKEGLTTTQPSSHFQVGKQEKIRGEGEEHYSLPNGKIPLPQPLPPKIQPGGDLQLEGSVGGSKMSSVSGKKLEKAPKGVAPITPKPEESQTKSMETRRKSTVIDKVISDVSGFTLQLFQKTKQFFSTLFTNISRKFSHAFGRKKRDLAYVNDLPENSDGAKDEKGKYYVKRFISEHHIQDNTIDAVNGDDNYAEIMKFVTAKESRMTAFVHVTSVLESFIAIAVSTCPAQFNLDELYLAKVCELIASLVMDDLIDAENKGMALIINERMERQLDVCAKDVLANTGKQ